MPLKENITKIYHIILKKTIFNWINIIVYFPTTKYVHIK